MRKLLSKSPLRRRAAIRVLSVTLIFATWRGPIPCVHIHSNDADAATPGLAEHVRSRHADELGEQHPYWHIHFMLPQDVRHTDDSPTSPDAPEDPLLAHSTLVQLSGTTAGVSLLLDWNLHAGAPMDACSLTGFASLFSVGPSAPDSALARDASFLTTMLRAAPLCAVTGVALC